MNQKTHDSECGPVVVFSLGNISSMMPIYANREPTMSNYTNHRKQGNICNSETFQKKKGWQMAALDELTGGLMNESSSIILGP
eukprot:m.433549 g.433549  ORF g.433549 m.433549 type:complete len:83 (-) comp17585_c0_seq1:1073-1321(-)